MRYAQREDALATEDQLGFPEWSKRPLGRRGALRGAALGVSGLAAAALLGCGDDEDDEPASSGSPQAGAVSTASDDPRYVLYDGLPFPYNFPEPAGKTPKPGGTLRVAATWDVGPMDPTVSAAGGTIVVPNMVYNRLLGFDRGPESNPLRVEVVPELAKSWEASPDGQTYTFKIDERAKWQNLPPLDGRQFVAEDAKLAFERYATEGVHRSYWVNLSKIEAVDAGTLKITLTKPTPEFEVPLAGRYQTIFPPELVQSGEIGKQVVGTGPMILREAVTSSHVALTKNPDYWQKDVLIDGAEFRMMPDAAARVAAFRANQVEYAYSPVENKRGLDELKASIPELQVNFLPSSSGSNVFGINNQNPRFQDVRVRRALSLAIDRQLLVQLVFEGLGATGLPSMPWIFMFDERPTEFGPWVKLDLAESKKLLQAAGQENFEFNYVYFPYSTAYEKISEVLVDQFRSAGITMKGGKVDYTAFNSQWVGGKLEEATTSGWHTAGYEANNYFYNQVHSSSPGNRWGIKDAEIDRLAELQAVELDREKRRELHKQMWDRELDQLFRIPQYAEFRFEMYQPWLRNLRFTGVSGTASSYYDWGAQLASVWLDK